MVAWARTGKGGSGMRIEGMEAIAQRNGRTTTLPRYERSREEWSPEPAIACSTCLPLSEVEAAIAASPLSDGSRALVRGLLRLGTARVFAGGGIGIEYGSLLKTAARPEYIGGHVKEVAAHLRARRVDLLLVPGMSGYPVGAMYSVVSGIPAVLLKKARLDDDGQQTYPAGAFVIPSYTGEGDVVMHADPPAVQDIVDGIVARQLAEQMEAERVLMILRAAGADDIIDKATMSRAVGESAVVLGEAAIDDFVRRHRAATGDRRPIERRVEIVAWVTPLIKGYNRPHEHLRRTFGIEPFAGVNVTSVHLQPPAIGVEGVGMVPFGWEG
jgi:hypothetical protein